MADEFRTIAAPVSTTTKVEGSRFLASALPVASREQADDAIASVRQRLYDATHHCFAYRLGTDGDEFRFSDDGEPSGTAGRPILTAIERSGFTNILVIVTRYFGGTKLGTGGLARAYGNATEQALVAAVPVHQYVTETLTITFPHSQTGNVMRAVSKAGAQIEQTEYDEEVHLTVRVRRSLLDDIGKELIDATSGNVRVGVSR